MPFFEQKILSPGRYHLGKGRYREITKEDIRDYVQGTRQVMDKGLAIPVLSEHPAPNSAEGSPVPKDGGEPQAAQFSDAIRTAGWLAGIRQGTDGSAEAVYEITSPEYAKAIREGSIRYTSPELRESWKSGNGFEFGRNFAHVALTPKPRHGLQDPAKEAALQFGYADIEPDECSRANVRSLLKDLGITAPRKNAELGLNDDELEETSRLLSRASALQTAQFSEVSQFQDGDDNPDNNNAQGDPETSDMPPDDTSEQMMKAIIAHLSELGVELPMDTDLREDFKVLLAALKTASAAKRKAESEAEKEETKEPEVEEEPMPVTQFSEEAQKRIDAQAEQLAKFRRAEVERNADSCRLPSLKKKLQADLETVQFSDEGTEEPKYTLSEVVELINGALPETMQFDAEDAEEQRLPEGYTSGDDATPEEVDEDVTGFLQRTGYLKPTA